MDFTKMLGKAAARLLIRKAAAGLFRLLIVKTSPIWAPVLALFLLVWIAWTVIFEMPKEAIRDSFSFTKEDRAAAFEYGQDGVDPDRLEQYAQEAARWKEGLSPEQLAQVEPYVLDASWLAAVDRTLGDPALVGIRDAKELKLEPEQTFELLRPKFEWRTFDKTVTRQTCEQIVEKDRNGKETIRYEIRTSTFTEPQILLIRATTIQGTFEHRYREEAAESTETSPCGELTTRTTYWTLAGITAVESNWEPLRRVLRDQGITEERDQEFLLDYWLSFLHDPDGAEHEPLPEGWTPVEGDLLWPARGRVSSRFGGRIDPIRGGWKMHNGVDIAAPIGTDVWAAADGEVVYAGWMGTAGIVVVLRHEGLETRYYHLSVVTVTKGQAVRRGELIGRVGSTGASTGPHLHFETRVGGEPVDPLIFFGGGTP